MGAAGLEADGAQLFSATAQRVGQQAERRGNRLDDHIDDDLDDDGPEAELRVVQRAADGQVQVNHAIAVGQQRYRQLDRQAGGGTLDLVTKAELVEDKLVGGGEPPVRQHHIVHVQAELAAVDAVTGVLDRVGRERRQLQVAHLAGDVKRERLGQRVELAQNLQGGRALGPAAQLQVGHVGHRSRTAARRA